MASVLTRTLLETNQEIPHFLEAFVPEGDARVNLKFEADSDWESENGDAAGGGDGWGAGNDDAGGDAGSDAWGADAGDAKSGGGGDAWGAADTGIKDKVKVTEEVEEPAWGQTSGGGGGGW